VKHMSGRTSVQDAVRIIVTRNPYLYRGLRMRVVNYSALARYIQGEVQTTFGDEVDPNTIVTAIMRLSNQLEEPQEPRSPLAGSRLNLVTGVSEVLIKAPPVKHTEIIERILKVGVFDSYMLSLHQTQSGIRVYTNSPDAEKVGEELKDHEVKVRAGFAELHLKLPTAMQGIEGALTMIVDVLSQNGVHAVDANEADGEISFILREDDAGRAFDALRTLSR
jgi:aspartokinase